ncbi:MAG: hypothetical protein QXW19_04430 [Candidatus Bathyarchaeia archaeon]
MSNYRCKEFLGFATSVPPNVVPDWFFERLFFPYVRERDGLPVEAPYGLRKAEAKLEGGFDVITVRPDRLGRWLDGAKVLGVHAMDPFGVAPLLRSNGEAQGWGLVQGGAIDASSDRAAPEMPSA